MSYPRLMVSILNADVSASDTALEETFTALPEIRFGVENIVITQPDQIWPCIWIQGHSRKEIREALHTDPTVTKFTYLTSKDDVFLYDIHVTEEAQKFAEIIRKTNGTLLSVVGTDGTWYLSLRFRTREAVSQVNEQMNEAGLDPTIHRIVRLSENHDGGSGLTERQREALGQALKYGYFDVPRQISLEELAAEIDISHQALSERLRRGYETLVRAEFENVSSTHRLDDWAKTENEHGL